MPVYQVDAFTSEPFAGNPAAVCLLDGARADAWMQAVAAEMNLAETAFLAPVGDVWTLRWFTPTIEVRLCGHATLASAHVLWETERAAGRVRFATLSGYLLADRVDDAIRLDFPAEPPEPVPVPEGLVASLGVKPVWVGRNRFDYLVEVEDVEAVAAVVPDVAGLRQVECRGVMVTAAGGDGSDFVSRYFAPAAGVDEDPVTGSAHCCLGPYWAERLGQTDLIGHQISARGGWVRVEVGSSRVLGGAPGLAGRALGAAAGGVGGVDGASGAAGGGPQSRAGPDRVGLIGQAVTVVAGQLRVV